MKRTSSELKRMAKGTLINRYSLPIGAYLITFVISIAVNIILTAVFPFDEHNLPTVTYIVACFITELLMAALQAGPTTILLDMSRGGTGQIKDVFYAFTHQPDRILLAQLLISLISLACELPSILVYAFAWFMGLAYLYPVIILLFIAGAALSIYLTLGYKLVIPLYIDCPQKGVLELLRESRMLMTGNKGRYFYLILSFLGIILLATFSCFIGLLWAIPYVELTKLEFYREIVGEI